MDAKLLHTRLIALVIGLVVAICAIVGISMALPPQDAVDPDYDYGCVYSGVKSSSVPFMKAAMDEESMFMFGSSEFSTPPRIVPQVPAAVFGRHDWGLHPMLVGEAFDQSLWHSIALGACAQGGVPRNKVVIFVGPGWFSDEAMDAETFATRFSYSLYSGFCRNDAIPAEVKSYVRERLHELGISDTDLNAAMPVLPQDYLNGLAFSAIDDLKLRQGLRDVREKGAKKPTREDGAPDFEAMREQALVDAQATSTNNDWGLEDQFYADRLEPALADLEGARAGETYSKTKEYDDFDCFLDIADACGIEVLVVIEPELGPYYDYIGIPAETRKACYDRIREVAASHNAEIADFSDREYVKYYLYDIVHFGTLGWTDANEAVYEFAMKEN